MKNYVAGMSLQNKQNVSPEKQQHCPPIIFLND